MLLHDFLDFHAREYGDEDCAVQDDTTLTYAQFFEQSNRLANAFLNVGLSSGEENIYPGEVDNVLFDHPAIADAAVIGVPDEQYGEALLGVIVLTTPNSLEIDELISYCRTRLGGFKVPRKI